MKTQRRVHWRTHLPLLLGVIGMCAFLALITAIIVSVNSAPNGWYWSH